MFEDNEVIDAAEQPEPVESVENVEEQDQDSISDEIETEEVEFSGKKYNLPKELKGALMANADYTRKTQEVAEQRKQIESQKAEIDRERERYSVHSQELSKLYSVEEQLKHFEGADWKALTESDPIQAQQLFITYNQLRDSKNSIAQSIQQREYENSVQLQQSQAKAAAEGQAILKRDIKDWSPELATKLSEFAINDLGFDKETVNQIYDPRVVKLLHAAYVGQQIINKGKAKPDGVGDIKPVSRVSGGGATATKDPGKMSDSEYAAWRRKAKR